MLYLDAPIGPIDGLMIFRDHADQDLFYYVPERPRLARNDGVPEFVFLIYSHDITDNPNLSQATKDQLGGGFLAFTVDLGVDDDQLDAIKRRLAAFAGGSVKLTPIQFRKGTVRLSITKDVADAPGASPDTPKGESFFEQIYGTSTPSLIGFNRATFGVILDHEGALLLEAALKSGISPIGVIYDLEYLGLRPAFNVKIHADYKRIYSSLELGFGLKAGVGPIGLAANIDLAWQKLKDEGAIKVEVINFTDDQDFRKQADAAFDWFKTELLRDFFKSSLEPPSFMRQGQNAGILGALQGILGPLTQTQTGPSTPTLGQPTTLAPTPAAPPTSLDSGVTSTSERNQAATRPVSPAQTAASNQTGGQGGLNFGVQLGFTLKKIEQEELKERDFEYSMQAAVAREAAPQGLFSTFVSGLDLNRAIKRVKLDDDFFKRINATFTLGADLAAEKIAAVTVNVEYPGVRGPGEEPTQVGGFAFTPTDSTPKNFQTWLNEHKDLRYRYKIEVEFASDSQWVGNELHFESDWQVTTSPSVLIDPFEALDRLDLEVALGSIDTSQIQQMQVELAYDDPAIGFEAQKTMVMKPGDPSQHWKLRLGETTTKSYRQRVTYFLPNNVRYQTDWETSEPLTTEAGTLVINDPYHGRLDMRLVPLLDPSQIVEANVDLLYHEDSTGFETRRLVTIPGGAGGPLAGQSIVIPTLSGEPVGVTATVTIVRTDGSVFEGEPTKIPADQRVIIVSDGVGTTHRIQVELASTDLASAGLVAVRVRLKGPGETPDSAEALFRASATAPQRLALVQPGDGAFAYHYEVEGYTPQGLPRAGQSGNTSDNPLIVGLPA